MRWSSAANFDDWYPCNDPVVRVFWVIFLTRCCRVIVIASTRYSEGTREVSMMKLELRRIVELRTGNPPAWAVYLEFNLWHLLVSAWSFGVKTCFLVTAEKVKNVCSKEHQLGWKEARKVPLFGLFFWLLDLGVKLKFGFTGTGLKAELNIIDQSKKLDPSRLLSITFHALRVKRPNRLEADLKTSKATQPTSQESPENYAPPPQNNLPRRAWWRVKAQPASMTINQAIEAERRWICDSPRPDRFVHFIDVDVDKACRTRKTSASMWKLKKLKSTQTGPLLLHIIFVVGSFR